MGGQVLPVDLAVRGDLLDVYRRRYRITVQVSWVDHLDDALICEPQSSGRILGCVWPERSRRRLRAVKHVQEAGPHCHVGGLPPSLQLRIWDGNKSACRVKPKGRCPVRDEGINDVARKAVPHRESLHPPVSPSDNSRRRCCQHRGVGIYKKAVDWAIVRAVTEREEFRLAISVSGQATADKA